MASETGHRAIPESLDRKLTETRPAFEYDLVSRTPIGSGKDQVYLAQRQDNGQNIAVKIVELRCFPGSGPHAWDDMMREIEESVDRYIAVARLRHDNIVAHLGFKMTLKEHDQAELALLMEYCSGGTLYKRSKSVGGFEVHEIKQYAKQTINGLKYLHLNGVCHRDLKGTNILLTGDNTVKICDFGDIVKLQSASRTRQGEVGRGVGTTCYMAPEMIDPAHAEPGRAADIYSFGCVLIEMKTGAVPQYVNDAGKSLKEGFQVTNYVGKGGSPVIPYISEGMNLLIRNCIQRHPLERPTAVQVAQTLDSMTA